MTGDTHQCPRCELRFTSRPELEHHLRHDHDAFWPPTEGRRPPIVTEGVITVAVDPSREPVAAVAVASHLARQLRMAVQVVAVPTAGVPAATTKAFLRARAREAASVGAPLVVWKALPSGDPVAGVVDHVASGPTNLLCLGTRARTAVSELVLGSVSAAVMRTAPVPVLLVGRHVRAGREPIKRIVVGLDGSELAERALRVATDLAQRLDAALMLVEVLDVTPPPDVFETSYLHRVADTVPASVPVDYDTLHWHDPGRAIADIAGREAGTLVVLGSHGRSGVQRVALGSVAQATVRHAACPVLVVPASLDTDRPGLAPLPAEQHA